MSESKPIPRRYAVTEWLRKDLANRVGLRESIRLMRRHPRLWVLLFRDLVIAHGVALMLIWLLEGLDPSLRFAPFFLGMAATLPGALLASRLLTLKRAEAEQEQADVLPYILRRTKREREIEPPS